MFIAAGVTAMIHSSSATIGIVMGLGAAGILDWTTAVAFSLGADLGTTITSWMASLNLSKNAKRTAYAHISFNIIGVCITIPLFFVSIQVLEWAMQFFGGDPAVPVIVDGKETFPLVPVAVGLYSTFFNVFNTLLLFPFIGVFERVLSRVGRTDAEDAEDYSTPKFLDRKLASDFAKAVPAVQQETARHLAGRRDVPRHRPLFQEGAVRSGRALSRNRHPQPRHPRLHGFADEGGSALRAARPDRQPDRGSGLHGCADGIDASGGAPRASARSSAARRKRSSTSR